jgi:hypothetical protein
MHQESLHFPVIDEVDLNYLLIMAKLHESGNKLVPYIICTI